MNEDFGTENDRTDKEFYLNEWRKVKKGENKKCVICYLYSILYITLPLATLIWNAYSRNGFVFNEKFYRIENIILFIFAILFFILIFWILEQIKKSQGIFIAISLFAGLYLAFNTTAIISIIITFSFVYLMSIAAPIGQPSHTLRSGKFGTLEFISVCILTALAFSTHRQFVALFTLSLSLVILTFIRSVPIESRTVTIYRFGKFAREKKHDGRTLYFVLIPWIEQAKYDE